MEIAEQIRTEITGISTTTTILGHLQRKICVRDRVAASLMGVKAVELLENTINKIVALK